MIEISSLTDKDVGRRVVWEIAPGVGELGRLGAWAAGLLVIFVPMSGSNLMRPVEVEPSQVRWANEGIRKAVQTNK